MSAQSFRLKKCDLRMQCSTMCVYRLTDTDLRTRSHNPSILLLLEYRPNSFGTLALSSAKSSTCRIPEKINLVGTSEMYSHHEIPLLLRHGSKRTIPQHTRVRDEDVHTTKRVQGSLDDAITVFCRANGGGCLATSYNELPVRIQNIRISGR